MMKHSTILTRVIVLAALAGVVAGCANTIRGIGKDTANSVNATQSAGRHISHAAKN